MMFLPLPYFALFLRIKSNYLEDDVLVIVMSKECEEMKKTYRKKMGEYRKHPIGRRLVVGVLCICLSLVSLPIDHFGNLAQAAQNE